MAVLTCPILEISHLNRDTRRVLLRMPAQQIVDFKAGQYLEVMIPGKGCPFSIANAPDPDGSLELHIRPTPGSPDSVEIEKLLDNAIELEIVIPKGDCFLETAPKGPLALIAASTGITQMKSILEFLTRQPLAHPVYLYWGVLSADDLYMSQQFQELESTEPNFHYVPVVSEPATSPDWQGKTGLVGEVALADLGNVSDFTVVVSGGPAMVYATLDAFVAQGMPEQNMLADVFSYAPRK